MRLGVFGDELSEGAFVSEVAVLAIQPPPTVIRGSKLLASDDWMGHDLKLKFASPADVMKELEDLHVAYVLVDRSPTSLRLPYFGQVLDLIDTNRDRLELVEQIDVDADKGPTRPLALYRLRFQSPGPPKVLEIQLKYSLGTVLRR